MTNSSLRSQNDVGLLVKNAVQREAQRRREARHITERPRNFYEFVQMFWHVTEPEELVLGRHLELMCTHLEAVSRGEIETLVINIPPGHTKSVIVSVMWTAWEWAEVDASLRFLCSSNNEDLAIRDSLKVRRILDSPGYKKLYGHRFRLESDQNAKTRYENTAKGVRVVKPAGSAMGERVDHMVLDDPNGIDSVTSVAERKRINGIYSDSLILRKGNPKRFAIVVVMQRLHADDLSGHILATDPDAVHLCLPEKFEPSRACVTKWGQDWRTEAGELLWAERYSLEEVNRQNAKMSSFAVAGQKQQNPVPTDGGVFAQSKLRYWIPRDRFDLQYRPIKHLDGTEHFAEIIPYTLEEIRQGKGFETQIQSWDMAEKDKLSSAFTVGQVWGANGALRYLLDQRRGRWQYSQILEEISQMTALWGAALGKYIEDKALGIVAIQQMRELVAGIVAIEPDGSKLSRAYAVEPIWSAEQVYFPHPELFYWVGDCAAEFITFPNSSFADQVDTGTQALRVLRQHSAGDDDSRAIAIRRSR
jgi:predicted phage terminase large subunit-like protein